jgi:hypothetical protein
MQSIHVPPRSTRRSTSLLLLAGLLLHLAYVPTSNAAESIFNQKGVNYEFGQWYRSTTGYDFNGIAQDFAQMRSMGMGWVRFSFGKHTQSNCTTQNFYTRFADGLDAHGLQGLVSIHIPNAQNVTASDTERAAFRSWLQTMVTCYKDRFQYWEVWNEPNYQGFWNIDPSTTDNAVYAEGVRKYLLYLQDAYTVIKSVSPGEQVLIGGLSQYRYERWMDEMIRQGGYQYFDIMAFHPYSDTGPSGVIQQLNGLKTRMAQNATLAAKPIWISELGFTADPNKYPGHTDGTEQTKATYLAQTWQQLKDNGISHPIIWYCWSCTGTYGGNGSYDLVNTDTTTFNTLFRPAYTTYQKLWPTYAQDTFTRTVADGWGSANTGGAYALNPSTTAANFDVNSGMGSIVVPEAITQRIATLNGVSVLNADIKVKWRVGALPVGGSLYTAIYLRHQAEGQYRASLRIAPTGTLAVTAQHYLASTGATTDVTAYQTLSDLTYTAGQWLWARTQIEGTYPTTIRIKVWADGRNEPASWQYIASDSAATVLQDAGVLGLSARVGGGVTNVPFTFGFDDLHVTGK